MTTATTGAQALPPIGRWIVPLLGLAIFINYVDRGNLATAAPLMKDELGLSATQFGVLVSAFFWTYMPAQLLAGWMAERANAYRTLAIGLALWALATFLTGFSSGFAMILSLRLLLGLGESVIFPCSSKLIAQHVHGHGPRLARRSKQVGLECIPHLPPRALARCRPFACRHGRLPAGAHVHV